MSGNGLTNKGADACQGDSGGPIVAIRDNGPEAIGVVSWGVGCGRVGYYGVYANTNKITDWLKTAAGHMGHALYAPEQVNNAVSGSGTFDPVGLLANFKLNCAADSLPSKEIRVENDGRMLSDLNTNQSTNWPFMVRIADGLCSGVLISNQHILTSADCCLMKQNGISFIDFDISIGYDKGRVFNLENKKAAKRPSYRAATRP